MVKKIISLGDKSYHINLGDSLSEVVTYTIDRDQSDDFMDSLKKKPFVYEKNQKVFITSKCTIPRAKIKQTFKALNLSITHDFESADHIVVDDLFFRHYCGYYHGYYYKAENLQKFVEEYDQLVSKVSNPDEDYLNRVKLIKQSVLKNPGLDMILTYRLDNSIDHFCVEYNPFQSSRQNNYNILDQYVEYYTKFSALKDKFVSEAAILALQESEIIIDDTLKESISKMLESSDESNHTIAIETIANCDYEKSALNVLLLLKEHGATIFNAKASRHVNFKSLMKYYDISRYYLSSSYRFDFDYLIGILEKKGLLSDKYIATLKPLIFEEFESSAPSKYFKIKDIIFEPINDKNQDGDS